MKVNVLGHSHQMLGIKNQDSCLELVGKNGEKVKIVCDGCTNINHNNPETYSLTHNEVGSGLFCLLYRLLDNPFDYEHFIENANDIMKKMLDLIGFSKEKSNDTNMLSSISYNLCFTILACFETKDNFIVYNLGDGAILVENKLGVITYIEKKYGKCPPYLVLNYVYGKDFKFEKEIFDKAEVNDVGIASDGIQHALNKSLDKNAKLDFDFCFKKTKSDFELTEFIKNNKSFFDDTTIVK